MATKADLKALKNTCGLSTKSGSVNVLVALRQELDATTKERLGEIGFVLSQIVSEKVVSGSIEGSKLDQLRLAPGVVEVEVATKLRPTV